MPDKEWMNREEAKNWLLENLIKMNRPLKMKEICSLASSINDKLINWEIIFTAVDDLIKGEKARSMIFPGKEEMWGLEKI